MVRDMANILLAERNGPPVGTKWVYKYSLILSVLIKAAAAQIGKPHPAEEILYIEVPK
jgi:hypothetical protein